MSERELIAMMAATLQAACIPAFDSPANYGVALSVDTAMALLAEIDARAAARREPPETYEQRLARADATSKRVVDQLNAEQHNAT